MGQFSLIHESRKYSLTLLNPEKKKCSFCFFGKLKWNKISSLYYYSFHYLFRTGRLKCDYSFDKPGPALFWFSTYMKTGIWNLSLYLSCYILKCLCVFPLCNNIPPIPFWLTFVWFPVIVIAKIQKGDPSPPTTPDLVQICFIHYCRPHKNCGASNEVILVHKILHLIW